MLRIAFIDEEIAVWGIFLPVCCKIYNEEMMGSCYTKRYRGGREVERTCNRAAGADRREQIEIYDEEIPGNCYTDFLGTGFGDNK